MEKKGTPDLKLGWNGEKVDIWKQLQILLFLSDLLFTVLGRQLEVRKAE